LRVLQLRATNAWLASLTALSIFLLSVSTGSRPHNFACFQYDVIGTAEHLPGKVQV